MDFYSQDHYKEVPEPNLDPPDEDYFDIGEFATAVFNEADRARAKFEAFHSCHEGYAVLLEEVEELKVLVFAKGRGDSARTAMKEECVQIAAMVFCFINELLVP